MPRALIDRDEDDTYSRLEDLRDRLFDEDNPKKYRKLKREFDALERQAYPEKFRIGEIDEKAPKHKETE